LDFDEIADEFEVARNKPPYARSRPYRRLCEPSLFCSGDASPSGAFVGARLICVRRTRKSFILALVVVFLAIFRYWSEFPAPGEYGVA
jgi:hypothetical protein